MNSYEKYVGEALKLGFSYAVLVKELQLRCEPELRAYCNPEQCDRYGTTWVCPPGCGSVAECQERVSKYRIDIVLQTVGEIPLHEGKWERLRNLQREHNTRLLTLADTARKSGLSVLPLTTGGCIVCESCTFPKEPCKEPDRRMHSLSAYGINVGDLCRQAGLGYSFTEGIVYYTACLLLA